MTSQTGLPSFSKPTSTAGEATLPSPQASWRKDFKWASTDQRSGNQMVLIRLFARDYKRGETPGGRSKSYEDPVRSSGGGARRAARLDRP